MKWKIYREAPDDCPNWLIEESTEQYTNNCVISSQSQLEKVADIWKRLVAIDDPQALQDYLDAIKRVKWVSFCHVGYRIEVARYLNDVVDKKVVYEPVVTVKRRKMA